MSTLYVRNQDDFRAATESDILTQARDVISQHYRRGAAVLSDERLTADYLQIHLVDFHHEVFGLIHLDARNRLIAVEHLFRGTLTGANVYPREVVRSVIQHGSAGVVLFHNYPSGVSEPIRADEAITHRIRDALETIDVRVHDHLIVGDPVYSFSRAGHRLPVQSHGTRVGPSRQALRIRGRCDSALHAAGPLDCPWGRRAFCREATA